MTHPSAQDLKKLINKLIEKSLAVRHQTETQPGLHAARPEFHAWALHIELFANQVGGIVQENIRSALNTDSVRYRARLRALNETFPQGARLEDPPFVWVVDDVVGLLTGLADAVDDGLLTTLEDRVASDVYSGVLAEALAQQKAGKSGIAAILMRVALDNGLRRLARRAAMANVDDTTASAVNTWLWKQGGAYPTGTFRAVEGWLAIGNAFTHDSPEVQSYSHGQIAKALEDVQGFLGSHGL